MKNLYISVTFVTEQGVKLIVSPDRQSSKLALQSLATATMRLQHAFHELMQQPNSPSLDSGEFCKH